MGKYEEALERAKAVKPLNEVFPELRESEDERIIVNIKKAVELYWSDEPLDEILSWLERQKEQKPTEFPKSEDYGIDGLYAAVDILQKTLGEVDGYQTDDGILEHKCAISAVKELYEQKPAEWSGEDEKMLNAIIEDIHCGTDFNAEVMREANIREKWLRERLKSLRPKPHWKPSEEQMKCLEDCVNRAREIYNASVNGYGAYHALSSLYHDLQKPL